MKKKGVVEVQFNWIFILIAGGVILFFFISLISKQSKIAESSVNIDALEYIDKIVSGTSMEIGTTRNVTINNLNLKVTESLITLADKKIEGKSLRNKIVFAPDAIKGNKLITHSLYWECPYKITPFLYLTSNEVKYLIANSNVNPNDDILVNELYEFLPEFTAKEIIPYEYAVDLTKYNNYEIRIIFFDVTNFPPIEDNPGSKAIVTALNIKPLDDSGTLDGYGRLEFYKKQNNILVNSGTSSYLKKESLLGAVISDTPEYYNENMRKALLRLNYITNITIQKEIQLQTYSGNDINLQRCSSVYDQILPLLYSINSFSKNQVISDSAFGIIYEDGKNLDLYNKDLQRASCPILY